VERFAEDTIRIGTCDPKMVRSRAVPLLGTRKKHVGAKSANAQTLSGMSPVLSAQRRATSQKELGKVDAVRWTVGRGLRYSDALSYVEKMPDQAFTGQEETH
jgi:hypothetical protein